MRRTAFVPFVIALLLFTCVVVGCKSPFASRNVRSESTEAASKKNSKTGKGEGRGDSTSSKIVGRLEDASIDESSGLVASRQNPGLYWTHNDSGDDPLIFALDRQGKKRGVWRVQGAKGRDWEDIAMGPGPERGRSYIYIGDIGDNNYSRREIIIYRLPEPLIEAGDAASSRKNPRLTETAEAIRVQYPDETHDSEALLVHPKTGDIYLATNTSDSASVIYKLTSPYSNTETNKLARVGEVDIGNLLGAMITGGDISPDGKRVVLCDYLSGYELSLDEDSTPNFDTIWKQPVVNIPLGLRQQGEAVCYRLDGAAVLATSEGRHAPVIEIQLR